MSQRWKMCPHAQERMVEMDLTRKDVLEVLLHPDVDYVSSRYGPTRRVAIKGRYAVPYCTVTRTVITVLWHTDDLYSRPKENRESAA